MSTIVSRLDVTQVFCEVDDFCSSWEKQWQQVPQLPSMVGERRSMSRMHLSEVITIASLLRRSNAYAFHGSGYRTFKEFYTLQVLPGWRHAFPNLVSYTRFVELMPWCLMLLCYFLPHVKVKLQGLSSLIQHQLRFVINALLMRISIFKGLVKWGKNSVGWHFGFKLHLIINDRTNLVHSNLLLTL